MASRYWVGNSGNWNDTSNWSATSGGASGASIPTSSDDVFFDANSFSTTGQTVTVNVDASCKDMDWTGATNSPTFSFGAVDLSIYGSLTFISSMSVGPNALQITGINFLGIGTHTIDMAGKTWPALWNKQISFGGAGTYTLQSNFSVGQANNDISFTNGTLNTNGFNVTTSRFNISGSSTRAINLSSTIVTCSKWDVIDSTNFTLDAGTSTIRTGFNTWSFYGAGLSYYNLELASDQGTFTINDNNTFNEIDIKGPFGSSSRTVKFEAGSTQTVGNLITARFPSKTTILRSTVDGTQWSLSASNQDINIDYVDLKDGRGVAGDYEYYAGLNSTDSGNNTNWSFTPPLYSKVSSPGSTGDINNDWTTPSNALASDDSYAESQVLQEQDYYNFSFNIPSGAVLNGIEVITEAKYENLAATMFVEISKDSGATYSNTNYGFNINTTTDKTYTEGDDNDLWGIAVSASDLSSLYVRYTREFQGGSPVALVDHVQLRIYYYLIDAVQTSASGTLALSGVVASKTIHKTSISGTLQLDGSVITISQPAEDQQKTYLYKVYENGTFIGIWKDVSDDPEIYQTINSPGSFLTTTIGRSAENKQRVYEDWITQSTSENIQTQSAIDMSLSTEQTVTVGDGTDIDLNYDVEVWVFYGTFESWITQSNEEIITSDTSENILFKTGAPNGKKLFTGYISRYRATYAETDEVEVTIQGYGAELQHFIINDGTNTTVAYNLQDPADMLTDFMDQYTLDGGTITYTANSITTTGNTSTYEFKLNTVAQGIDRVLKQSPDDFYWYIDQAENVLYLSQKSATADHTFIFGKHIESISVDRHIEELKNDVYVVGGDTGAGEQLLKQYTDSTSITNYRRGLEIISDSRLTNTTSANFIGNRLLDFYDTPRYSTEVIIADNVFDIEAIRIGEMVNFSGFGNFIDDLLLQVVAMKYTPNSVTLTLDSILPPTEKLLETVKRNLENESTKNVPDAPS